MLQQQNLFTFPVVYLYNDVIVCDITQYPAGCVYVVDINSHVVPECI